MKSKFQFSIPLSAVGTTPPFQARERVLYLVSEDPKARLRFARIATIASGNSGKRSGKSYNQCQQTTEPETLMTCVVCHNHLKKPRRLTLAQIRRNWQFIAVTSASHSGPAHALSSRSGLYRLLGQKR
jgi:hypothetical protein